MAKELTLPYPPSLNRMYRMVNGRFLISSDGRKYKRTIEQLCQVERLKPMDGDICVVFHAYRPRKTGDLDNTFKVLLDSVRGYLWHDDKQVTEIHAYRKDDKNNPRIEISVSSLETQNEQRGSTG